MDDCTYTVYPGAEVNLTGRDIDDIMSTALDSISYWCCKAEVVGRYLGKYASDQISRGGKLFLYDAESNHKWELTLQKFLTGIKLAVEWGFIRDLNPDWTFDVCEIDGAVADSILQLGLFENIRFS